MSESQIEQLKEKLKSQQQEFESYKASAKQLEQFMQGQAAKKQQQVVQLKQDSIKKQKNFSLLKTQVNQLQTENANLKAELTQLKSQKDGNSKQQQETIEQYKKRIEQLQKSNKQIEQYKKHIEQLQNSNKQLQNQHENLKEKINISQEEYEKNKEQLQSTITTLQQQIQHSNKKIQQLQTESKKQHVQSTIKKSSQSKQHKQNNKQKKTEKSDINNKQEQKLKKQLQKLNKKITELEAQNKKIQLTNHQQNKKIHELTQQLLQNQQKIKQCNSNTAIKLHQVKQDKEESQNQFKQQNKSNFSQIGYNTGVPLISAIIMTKKHYSSPFLQLKSDNLIKMLKSTKNGCFEKSMGSTKYKLSNISYDTEQIIQTCSSVIKKNINNGIKNSIIFYGPKSTHPFIIETTKKYLMANLLLKLKDFLLEKIKTSEQEIQAVYINTSSQPQKKIQTNINNKQEINQLFNVVLDIANKSQKKTNEIKKKNPSKPKIRYFKVAQGDIYLEIITTSFSNIVLKQSLSISDALNNIVYSKLPNALQPLDCYREVILTLNPIVSLYDQCKNILSIANCKKSSVTEETQFVDQRKQASPIKDQLNDIVRKKFQSFERQNEQNILRTKKQQQQINYYKTKFDELQVRLKNLLNTHRQQNTYLKKSPVTLSYQKMLKFVHIVKTKNPTIYKDDNQDNQDNLGGGGYEEFL